MFSEDKIRRNDLPRDAFQLIHDLCYDHEGRDRDDYKKRARKILAADCDTSRSRGTPIKKTRIRKSDKAKVRSSLTAECDKLTKQIIIHERGNACERCGKTADIESPASAHIKSKGHYKRIRFYRPNLLLLCYRDHIEWAHKEPDDFLQWVEQKWPGRLEQLRIQAAISAKTDLKLLVICLRAEVRALGIEG